MSKSLKLAQGLSLPSDEAITQTIAILGRKGGGKSYTGMKLAELMLGAKAQVIVLDMVGRWYGLRLSEDGKSPGFDVVVLGGLRGDIPLTEESGALIADTVVETERSFILDLSQFSKSARRRFATAFATRLWERKKSEMEPTPLHLFIEECQLLIPQNAFKGDEQMLGIFEEMVRLGRNYGIGVSMISQRPQSVNKEALTQAEVLIVHQVNGTPERKAIGAWIVDKGMDVSLLDELPGLEIGTAFFWSPQWLRCFQKIEVLPRETYDSSATPKSGARKVSAKLAPLDLAGIQERMSSLVEEAKVNDPKALKARIAQLEKELAAKVVHAGPTKEALALEKSANERAKRLDALAERACAAAQELTRAVSDSGLFGQQVVLDPNQRVSINSAMSSLRLSPPIEMAPIRSQTPVRSMRDMADVRIRPVSVAVEPPEGLSVYATGLLATAWSRLPMKLTRTQLALLSNRSTRSSAFSVAMTQLVRSGYLLQRGHQFELSSDALQNLGSKFERKPQPASGEELRESWLRALPAYEAVLLKELMHEYPSGLLRDELSRATGKSLTSSAFSVAISTLKKNELVHEDSGALYVSDVLYPEGQK